MPSLLSAALESHERAPMPVQLVWVVLWFGPVVWALVHLTRRTEAEFRAAGASKTAWAVLVVLAGPLAAVPYLFTLRRRLNVQHRPPRTGEPV